MVPYMGSQRVPEGQPGFVNPNFISEARGSSPFEQPLVFGGEPSLPDSFIWRGLYGHLTNPAASSQSSGR
jgi:hypothetical protein